MYIQKTHKWGDTRILYKNSPFFLQSLGYFYPSYNISIVNYLLSERLPNKGRSVKEFISYKGNKNYYLRDNYDIRFN